MQAKLRRFAPALVGAAATLATASGFACTIAPTHPMRIKQLMAQEIAHRLGLRPQQISLDSITTPQLITPLGLGADCSGLGAYHHTAGFRVLEGKGPGPWPSPGAGPAPWPRPAPAPSPDAGPDPDHEPDHEPVPGLGSLPRPGYRPAPWPLRCVYEGVAVVLGHGYSSPVAVNFERRCR